MAPSGQSFNPFSEIATRMNKGGGGLIAQQRQMQFQLGMAHLEHQFGLQRDAVQHSYSLEMAKAQGKQQRKTIKTQNKANMKRDTNQSSLKIQEGSAATLEAIKEDKGIKRNEVQQKKALNALPLPRETVYAARQAREHDTKMQNIEESRATSRAAEAALNTKKVELELEKMKHEWDAQKAMMPGIMSAFGMGAVRPAPPSFETLARGNYGRLVPGQQAQAPQSPQPQEQSSQERKPVTIAEFAAQRAAGRKK